MDKKIKDLLDEFYKDTGKPVPVIEYLPEETLISKKYQFIERLITKGKVDNKKLIDLTAKDDCVVIMRFEEDSQKVKVLLLMLAISDNPLDDLISVLKE